MFASLRSTSDHQLLANTDTIAAQDRTLTLKLLAHLHEIERRKLYLSHGYSSMFDYCTSRLRLSEGSAMRRIKTARCLARFPELFGLLEAGDVNLMSVALISRVLKPENAAVLIARIRGKSKREVETVVAEYEPQPTIPPDRVRPVMIPVVAAAPPRLTATGDGKKSASDVKSDSGESVKPATPEIVPASAPVLQPHSVVRFAAGQDFMAKVDRARALVWHQFPAATFEQLFGLALDELIARRDPRERQKRREKRRAAWRSASAEAGKRYVPAPVRDQVFMRDGFQCTFVGPDDRRCTASVCLQVDHVKPVAHGGASRTENLRVLCAQHNRLESDRLMGSR